MAEATSRCFDLASGMTLPAAEPAAATLQSRAGGARCKVKRPLHLLAVLLTGPLHLPASDAAWRSVPFRQNVDDCLERDGLNVRREHHEEVRLCLHAEDAEDG